MDLHTTKNTTAKTPHERKATAEIGEAPTFQLKWDETLPN